MAPVHVPGELGEHVRKHVHLLVESQVSKLELTTVATLIAESVMTFLVPVVLAPGVPVQPLVAKVLTHVLIAVYPVG
jgi:hypothetical protein